MTPGRPAVQLADQNWATSQAARATIASFTAAVRAAQIVVGLQEEALTGTRTVLDVLVDEQQRFTTQAQLVTAERDTAIRRVQCRPRPAVIGGITQRYRDQISRGRRRADPGEFCGQTAGAEFPGYAGK